MGPRLAPPAAASAHESAPAVERGEDPVGEHLDELDPAVGQPGSAEDPGPEIARDDLTQSIGVIDRFAPIVHQLWRHDAILDEIGAPTRPGWNDQGPPRACGGRSLAGRLLDMQKNTIHFFRIATG
jgi:hypothetical protein